MTPKEWIGLLASLSVTIITIWKWLLPYLSNYYAIHFYNHSVGHKIVRDIENKLGKEASDVLVAFMKDSSGVRANHNQRLNIIENTLGLGIYVCDISGLCIYANDTLAAMFGLSKQEMIGSGWLAGVKEKQRVYADWMFSVNNRVPYRNEYILVVNGVEHKCLTEAEETKTADGLILGYVGIVKYLP